MTLHLFWDTCSTQKNHSKGKEKSPRAPGRRGPYLVCVADVLQGRTTYFSWESIPRDDTCEAKPNRMLGARGSYSARRSTALSAVGAVTTQLRVPFFIRPLQSGLFRIVSPIWTTGQEPCQAVCKKLNLIFFFFGLQIMLCLVELVSICKH